MISVIIPHLNQPDALEACLRSLDAQTLNRTSFEVIVIDNGSATPPGDVLARHPGVRLLHEPRPGPGPARNAGVAAANGEILAFIDADCRAHQDWLSSVMKWSHSSPAGTVLGGDVRIWRPENARLDAIAAYESVFAYRFKLYIERHGYSGTGNMAVFRRDFDRVGPFAGIEVAEDMEWGERALRAGLRFQYTPEMIVFHPARSSLRELYAKWDRHIAHYRNMAEGKPIWRLRWLAQALIVLASLAPNAVTVLTSDRLRGSDVRLKAIAVLCAVRTHRAMTMLSHLRGRRAVAWNR
ncbi:glycosyltransferase [Bradyrhizobium yuanmingense]|uniref:glycosyltransferase n=1 Tax=Bradyrhizobium yuanmingense TaxID=108015 RepID=UPI0023BA2C43|nr:glycosyltransferase [Bradyrhizobium yuanmingense]MDF0494661.1 glycosyltransferase [Bradyrhizobium yuanmingense]